MPGLRMSPTSGPNKLCPTLKRAQDGLCRGPHLLLSWVNFLERGVGGEIIKKMLELSRIPM
eukprot:1160995-Pelagomonas_calceolata.AAC.2